MDDQILAIYCLCDDMLKALDHNKDPQCQMSDTEVLTMAMLAPPYFEKGRKRIASPFSIENILAYFGYQSRENRCLNPPPDIIGQKLDQPIDIINLSQRRERHHHIQLLHSGSATRPDQSNGRPNRSNSLRAMASSGRSTRTRGFPFQRQYEQSVGSSRLPGFSGKEFTNHGCSQLSMGVIQ